MGGKDGAIGQAQIVGGADVKRATDVQTGVGTKEHPTGIEQVQMGAGNLRADEAINEGLVAAGDATQDIGDVAGAREGGTFPRREVEVPKAVKQIRATDLPDAGRDLIVGTRES